MSILIPTFFLPIIWVFYATSIERWLPFRTHVSARGRLVGARSWLLRLAAALYTVAVFDALW